jgi:hypothetical protein
MKSDFCESIFGMNDFFAVGIAKWLEQEVCRDFALCNITLNINEMRTARGRRPKM